MPELCPWWLGFVIDNPLRRWLQKPEEVIAPYVSAGMTVLDLGCGMGVFTLPMARRVGPEGRILAVDLQQKMLDHMLRRAERTGLRDRIAPVLAAADCINVDQPVDFALAFAMVHEVRDKAAFLGQVAACLLPGKRLLIAEPKMHVSDAALRRTMAIAGGFGLEAVERPAIRMARSVLLQKR